MLPNFTVNRSTPKWVLGKNGLLKEVPANQPAIEYYPNGEYRGLLVEPAATNVMYPSIPDNTWDNTAGTTLTLNDEIAPDGTTTATKLDSDGPWIYRNSIAGTNVGTWTTSCWVKAVTDGVNNTFRLSTGGNNLSPNLTATTEWQRFEFTVTNGGGTVNGLIRDSSSNAANLYIWGAQVETGPIATSYIPTEGSSEIRTKDDISMTGASSLIGQTEGTLYVEVDWRLSSGDSQYLLEISDGTFNNRISIRNTVGGELRTYAQADGATPATNQGVSSLAYSGIQKIAFAYADNDFELYRNGSSISFDTSGSLSALATLTDIDIGQAASADAHANMHIRSASIYKRRLTDAECIALTTL